MEVAVRALSPGINDPHTAISVLDRLGAALCDVAPLHLSTGVSLREGRLALVVPSVSYDGLTDTMFHSNPGSTVGGRICSEAGPGRSFRSGRWLNVLRRKDQTSLTSYHPSTLAASVCFPRCPRHSRDDLGRSTISRTSSHWMAVACCRVKYIHAGSKTHRAVVRPIADAESEAPGFIRARSINSVERHRLVRFAGVPLYGQKSCFVAGAIDADRRTRISRCARESKTCQKQSGHQARPEIQLSTRS